MLNLITQCWKDTDLVAKSRQSSSIVIDASASELLRIAISIEIIAQRAMKAVIECIQAKQINGRSAIYCISEIRIALFSRESYEKFIEPDSLMDAIDNIRTLAELCITPFFTANKKPLQLQEASVCLDLFPAAINLLSSLRKRIKRCGRYEIDVLDTFLSNKWHPTGFLPLCSIVCELFTHLQTRHLQEFKVRLIRTVHQFH